MTNWQMEDLWWIMKLKCIYGAFSGFSNLKASSSYLHHDCTWSIKLYCNLFHITSIWYGSWSDFIWLRIVVEDSTLHLLIMGIVLSFFVVNEHWNWIFSINNSLKWFNTCGELSPIMFAFKEFFLINKHNYFVC